MDMSHKMNYQTLYTQEYMEAYNYQLKNNLNKRSEDILKLNNCTLNNQISNKMDKDLLYWQSQKIQNKLIFFEKYIFLYLTKIKVIKGKKSL